MKLGLNSPLEERVVTKEDFIGAIKYVIGLRVGEGMLDDIDHLGSRRVRTVGELLANQCRVGLARTERLVKERMTLFDANVEIMTPQKLINPKALSRAVSRGIVQALKSVTCILRTTVASAPSRRLKVRTSASSAR